MKPKETNFEPKTLGEHVRKRRLEIELSQKQAGKRLGVTSFTVLNWEKGKTAPPIGFWPAILRFLGYDPFPAPRTLPERLTAKRRAEGWSIKLAATQLGVDEGTWRSWERGQTDPLRKHRASLARILRLSKHGRYGT